jgi:general secretion pathway protein A
VYDTYYKLGGMPFTLTPDARFFFSSSGHGKAIAHLLYGLAQQEGFIVITGEVGAGKTTLVEQLWSQLDRKAYAIARIVTTQVSGDDLLRLVIANFGLGDQPGIEKSVLLRRFEQGVRDERKQGRRCLLVIDEVQNLSLAGMEELRMLSNITVDGKACLQTILLGQPQFRPILASKDWEQLRQRVLASFHLGPLTEDETRLYIEHRLHTVGWRRDNPCFDAEAFAAVHQQTGGIPRRINTLCSRVLLLGALEEVSRITAAMVESTAEELIDDLGAGLQAPPPQQPEEQATLLRRIEALEGNAFRQEQALRRVIELLETQVARSL